MDIHTKYEIGQYVKIKAVDLFARISKITIDGKNLFYEVSYWFEGQLKFVNLEEDEIMGDESLIDNDEYCGGKQLKRWKM